MPRTSGLALLAVAVAVGLAISMLFGFSPIALGISDKSIAAAITDLCFLGLICIGLWLAGGWAAVLNLFRVFGTRLAGYLLIGAGYLLIGLVVGLIVMAIQGTSWLIDVHPNALLIR
jgi:hypothetical protein